MTNLCYFDWHVLESIQNASPDLLDIFPSLWSVFCRTNSSRNYREMVEPTESEQEQSSEGTTITAKA